MIPITRRAIVVAAVCLVQPAAFGDEPATSDGPHHAIAMHGSPALPPGFTHFPYAEPAASKGGRLALGVQGTFDSLNPFNLRAGSTAQGLIGNIFQPLMARSLDEPFSLYGLVAESIETDDARSYATFRLDPRARFSDGQAITADDILFTFELLKRRGRPQQRAAFALVRGASAPDARTIRYDLAGIGDREMPLTLALMPVLPRHATDVSTFDDPSLAVPVGSGPYRIAEVRAGERLVLARDPAYWAKDLPSQRGSFNFDAIDIEYYRDANSMFEAFRAGLLDVREETSPSRWANAYEFPAIRDGRDVREALPIGGPKGMTGFAFNLRRGLFDDVRVREALGLVFDFEWVNANLYDGLLTRTQSFFDESDLAAVGRPASAAERALLAPFPGAVRDDILDGTWHPQRSDGSGLDRVAPRRALALLAEAGYEVVDGQLIHEGRPFVFEIMVQDRIQERLALDYADSLARIGVVAQVRLVDEVQYQRRRQTFEFDMMVGAWLASASPGNEQRARWGSASADQPGSFNLAGVKNPAIDALIDVLLAARRREDFTTAVRAYDRVLLSGFYIVPLFHAANELVAWSAALGRPATLPAYGPPVPGATFETWWRESR